MSNKTRGSMRRALLIIGRIALAAIFLFAAYMKMKPQAAMAWSAASVKTSLAMFAMQVDSYQLLSPAQVNFVAHTLPFFELALGLWLLSGIVLRYSSLVSTVLLAAFFSLMLRSFALHQDISCGCFGPGEQIGPKSLARDGSFLALAVAVMVGAFMAHRQRRMVTSNVSAQPNSS